MSTVKPGGTGFPHASGDEVYDPTKMFKKPAPLDIVDDRAKYRTRKDILIPAGTEVLVDPPGTERRFGTAHALVLIEVTRDHTAGWSMDLADAIETGLVEPVE